MLRQIEYLRNLINVFFGKEFVNKFNDVVRNKVIYLPFLYTYRHHFNMYTLNLYLILFLHFTYLASPTLPNIF